MGVGFWLITYGQLQFGKLTAFQSYQMQVRPTPARLHAHDMYTYDGWLCLTMRNLA